jgi:hypothetical protein
VKEIRLPAKLIKDFRKKATSDKPILKGLPSIPISYIGADQLDVLSKS